MKSNEIALALRVAKTLKVSYNEARNLTLNEVIERLLNKIDNDCINIDDMIQSLENMKVEK